MIEERTEIRDGMRITFDMPIPMDDGIVLRCDVFRPVAEGRYPVIMTHGAYGKGLAFQEKHAYAWERMAAEHPDTVAGSSNKYQNWEVVDPEKWVPEGYAIVRVDCRGSGRSPGILNPWSPREIRDYHDCIEWAARQPWCSGKVGLNGISYYARTQWYVASLQPPHLAAICVWEGAQDCYRDITHHGGMVSDFMLSVFPRQILNVQHGVGERGSRCPWDGGLVAGPETLTEAELKQNRVDMAQWIIDHPLDDHVHRERTPDLAKVTVPLLSCGNWGGHGLHLRGNLDGYHARGIAREMARGAWRHALGAFLHGLRRGDAEALLRAFPQGREELGERAAGAPANPPPRPLRRAAREGMAPGAHALDQILARSVAAPALARGAARGGAARIRGDGQRAPVRDRAVRGRDRDHRPARGKAVRLVEHERCRSLPHAASLCPRRQRGGVPGRERPACGIGLWLAARLATQARSRSEPAGKAAPHA